MKDKTKKWLAVAGLLAVCGGACVWNQQGALP